MLGIFSDVLNTASRVNSREVPQSQAERHAQYLAKKKQERRELEMARDRAFYRRW